MKTLAVLSFVLILSLSPISQAEEFNYPGGIVDLTIDKYGSDLPEIKYGIREPVIIDQGNDWRVLIGISLETLPGEYLLYVKPALKDMPAEHKKFEVRQHSYPLHSKDEQRISDSLRLHKEFSQINFSNTEQPHLPLRYPIEGQWADFFGHTIYEAEAKRVIAQNLVSLTTTELLTVHAPQNAIVSKIETDENGLATIFLDHGRGLFSIISGVADLSIEPGNGVVAGAVIGKLPAQISVDRPMKITWQCVLNGAYVNPIILTKI